MVYKAQRQSHSMNVTGTQRPNWLNSEVSNNYLFIWLIVIKCQGETLKYQSESLSYVFLLPSCPITKMYNYVFSNFALFASLSCKHNQNNNNYSNRWKMNFVSLSYMYMSYQSDMYINYHAWES